MKVSFVWNYCGHNAGFYQRGPNWFQLTLPPSRKARRCAIIVRWVSAGIEDIGG